MHILQLSRRNSSAQGRMLYAARMLAKKFELAPQLATALRVQQKDPVIRAMMEREAMATLLEELAKSADITLYKTDAAPSVIQEGETAEAIVEVPEESALISEEGVIAETVTELPPPVMDEDEESGE